MDTTSIHTYPTKTINENGAFRKRSPEMELSWKRCFHVYVWAVENGTYRKSSIKPPFSEEES